MYTYVTSAVGGGEWYAWPLSCITRVETNPGTGWVGPSGSYLWEKIFWLPARSARAELLDRLAIPTPVITVKELLIYIQPPPLHIWVVGKEQIQLIS
jgi:hypothetical protein